MKLLTDKTIIAMKREIISKMYLCACKVYEDTYPHGEKDGIPDKHEEILSEVLLQFYNKPTGLVSYDWTNTPDLSNLIPKNK